MREDEERLKSSMFVCLRSKRSMRIMHPYVTKIVFLYVYTHLFLL